VIYYSGGIPLTWPPQPAGDASLWSAGLNVRSELVSVDETFLALDVEFVASKIIRTFNGAEDDDLIKSYIRAATELAEHETQTSIRPQRLALVTNGVPALGVYELPFDPVREVISYDYYDGANALQTLSGSPAPWMFVNGGRYQPSTLQAAYGASWGTVVPRPDAVRIVYDAGYATAAEIPQMIKTGIGLVACELYKNPDLSNDMGQVKNVLDVSRFWPRRW
jgi:uncharacterized phiE125 gp8 family phage protein